MNKVISPLEVHFPQSDIPTRYKLIKLIATGSFGHMAQALDTSTQHKVAIKKVKLSFDQTSAAKKVLRELSILRRLNHPNLVKIIDVLPPKDPDAFDVLYVVTEYCQSDLRKFMDKKEITIEVEHVKRIAYQILKGLEYMEHNRLLHRKLKPANILINQDISVKICDLGQARSIQSSQKDWADFGEDFNQQVVDIDSPPKAKQGPEGNGPNTCCSFGELPSDSCHPPKPLQPIIIISATPGDTTQDSKVTQKFSTPIKAKTKSLRRESRTLKASPANSQNAKVLTLPGSAFSKAYLSRQLTYNCVARWYRAPEVILKQDYDQSMDMWSFGCIFAELLDRLDNKARLGEPFFQKSYTSSSVQAENTFLNSSPVSSQREIAVKGNESIKNEQLTNIFNIIGTPTQEDLSWVSEGSVALYLKSFASRQAVDLKQLLPAAPTQALQLLSGLIAFDPRKRLKIKEVLQHSFFKNCYQTENFATQQSFSEQIELSFGNSNSDKEHIRRLFLQEIDHHQRNTLVSL